MSPTTYADLPVNANKVYKILICIKIGVDILIVESKIDGPILASPGCHVFYFKMKLASVSCIVK